MAVLPAGRLRHNSEAPRNKLLKKKFGHCSRRASSRCGV